MQLLAILWTSLSIFANAALFPLHHPGQPGDCFKTTKGDWKPGMPLLIIHHKTQENGAMACMWDGKTMTKWELSPHGRGQIKMACPSNDLVKQCWALYFQK